jgi:two-component system chemotaxis response regulator CheY
MSIPVSASAENQVNVLIVDDDAMARLILRQVMQGHFHATVEEATNGLEALVALERSTFDLVILDLVMPVMDGLTVLRTIRATDRLKSVPVVVLTADRKDEHVQRSIQLGVDDYLTKPFRGKEIADRLSHVLATHAATSEMSVAS